MSKGQEDIVLSTLWSAGCGSHGGCGCQIYVEDGKVTRVEGNPNHPFNQGRLCAKGLAVPQYMYHPDRVKYPLKRVGERGEGKWERITWDEAYDTIEKRFKDIREKHGAESVIFCQGTGRDIGGPITFLMYAYGAASRRHVRDPRQLFRNGRFTVPRGALRLQGMGSSQIYPCLGAEPNRRLSRWLLRTLGCRLHAPGFQTNRH